MSSRELSWRAAAMARAAVDRAAFAIKPPRWNRRTLAKILARGPELAPARQAAEAGDWDRAQVARHRATVHLLRP